MSTILNNNNRRSFTSLVRCFIEGQEAQNNYDFVRLPSGTAVLSTSVNAPRTFLDSKNSYRESVNMKFWHVLVTAALASCEVATSWRRCNVVDYGAIGDNVTDDTSAFRAAIAACAAGGEVIVPAVRCSDIDCVSIVTTTAGNSGKPKAVYRTDPVNLTSNMVLVVETGATMVATGYKTIKLPPLPSMGGSVIAGGGIGAGDHCRFSPIVSAWNASNVTLTGGGMIDGQGLSWYNYESDECGKPLMFEFNWITVRNPIVSTTSSRTKMLVITLHLLTLIPRKRNW